MYIYILKFLLWKIINLYYYLDKNSQINIELTHFCQKQKYKPFVNPKNIWMYVDWTKLGITLVNINFNLTDIYFVNGNQTTSFC